MKAKLVPAKVFGCGIYKKASVLVAAYSAETFFQKIGKASLHTIHRLLPWVGKEKPAEQSGFP
jgi:hypothetical protein